MKLLGERIRLGRRRRHWTQAELAERAGVSGRTVLRAESGDPGVALGVAFELATLTGTTLFQPDRERLTLDLDSTSAQSALLPKRVVTEDSEDDDF